MKRPGGALIGEGMLNEEQQQELQQELEQQQQLQQLQLRQQQLQEQQLRQQQQQQQEREQQLQQLQQQQLEKYQQRHAHTNSNDSFTSWAFVKDGGVKSIVNLAEVLIVKSYILMNASCNRGNIAVDSRPLNLSTLLGNSHSATDFVYIVYRIRNIFFLLCVLRIVRRGRRPGVQCP